MSMRIVGVIPSRWGSTRFPGKSLAMIAGRTLLDRVIERVRMAQRLDAVWVATDDERIAMAARSYGAEAILTRPEHPSGTDRIAEALQGREADGVVNIQGDEPLLDPAMIDAVAGVLADSPEWDMVTAACPITTAEELHSPDVVKVVRANDGCALYFSRAVIPFLRGAPTGFSPVAGLHLRHIGLYGYRRAFLERLVKTPPSPLEQAEKLEQLRALQLGCRMKVLDAPASGIGVDTPADVARVEACLRQAAEK